MNSATIVVLIVVLALAVVACAAFVAMAVLRHAAHTANKLTDTRELGPLHVWSKWELAEPGHEVLAEGATEVSPTQERRCARCGLRQVDEIGELSQLPDEHLDGRCDVIWGRQPAVGEGIVT